MCHWQEESWEPRGWDPGEAGASLDLAAPGGGAVAPSTEARDVGHAEAGGSSDGEAADAEDLLSLRDVFRACDANGDGTINLRELIKACRQRPEVAAFFGLPSEIHQEGASRKAVMEFFQGADRNDDREITWEELRQFYRERRPVGVSPQRSSTSGGGGGRRDAEGSPPHAQPRPPPQGALPPPLRPPAAEAADAPALEDGGPQGSGGSRPPSEGPRAGGAAAYPVSEEGAATSARDSRQTASAALAAAAPALAPPRRAWRPAGGSAELYQQRQPRSGGGGPLPSRQASPWPGAAGGGLDAGRQRREPLRGDLVSHRGAACLLLEIRTSGAANEKPYAVLQTVDGRVRVETDLSKLSLMAETFSPTAEDAEFKVGSKVMVQRPKGFPWKCSVIGIEGDYLRIHYQGFPDDFDEWLPKASWRITRAAARTTGPHAAGPRRRPRSASSGGERTQLRRAEARLQTACEELEWSRAACLAAEEAVREAQADVERQLHASVRGARQRLARAEQGARSCLRHTGVALPRRCHASPPAALRGRAPLGAGHAAAGASAYELLQMLNASPGYDAMHPVAWAADMWPPIRPG